MSEKRIREAEAQLEQKGRNPHGGRGQAGFNRAEDLKTKRAELDEIIAETRAEEEILNAR